MMTISKNKPVVSFIMPAYNAEKFISDPIKELQKKNKINWELIIIDDFSRDKTFKVVKNFRKKDKRIRVYKNLRKGKVLALNYGFSKSKGEIIKLIDSDDVLSQEYFNFLNKLKKYEAHCHNFFITDSKLDILFKYNVNPSLIFDSYKYNLVRLISFPKAVWSFNRQIANKIFPMPDDLPFEDVWISLIIKKNSKNILKINKPIYKYRQHDNQTFGGILSFSKKKIIFRARRMLKLIKVLKKEARIVHGFDKNILENIKNFFQMMSSKNLSYYTILTSDQYLNQKIKLMLYKKIPKLTNYALKIKWILDEFRKS